MRPTIAKVDRAQNLVGVDAPGNSPRSQMVTRWRIGNCHVDLERQLVMAGDKRIELRPKLWDLLCLLLQRPNALVSINMLMDGLWPRQEILPKALVNLVSELRLCLGQSDVLQAVPRRGYLLTASPASEHVTTRLGATGSGSLGAGREPLVGRAHELAQFNAFANEVPQHGMRLLGLSGQAGVGKTSLVRRGTAELSDAGWTVLSGRCMETSRVREALAPLLMALQHWAQDSDEDVVHAMEQFAPCWLALMPGLVPAAQSARLREGLAEAGTLHMARELMAFFQHLGASRRLALVIEDLHWADSATLELLAAMLSAASALPLMMILTWRPHEAPDALALLLSRLEAAPLNRIAYLRQLTCFTEEEVSEYLALRWPHSELTAQARTKITHLTGGLPLFLKLLCDGDELESLQREDLPTGPSLAHLSGRLSSQIYSRVSRLGFDLRALLQVASCMTSPAPLPVLAQVLQLNEDLVLEQCRRLAAIGLFEEGGMSCIWLGGAMVPAYGPAHEVIRSAVAERIEPETRVALNHQIAMALKSACHTQGFSLHAPLVHAYVGANLHLEAVHHLRDTSARLPGRFARPDSVRSLEASLDHLAEYADSDVEAVSARIEVCNRITMLEPFDCRSSNTLTRRAYTLLLQDTRSKEDDRSRLAHAVSGCVFNLNIGRADLAQSHTSDLLQRSKALGLLEQSHAHVCMSFVAEAMGEYRSMPQLLRLSLKLLIEGCTTDCSVWIDMVQAILARSCGFVGELREFKVFMDKFLLPGPPRRSAVSVSYGSVCLANALVQFGCRYAAASLFQAALDTCEQTGVRDGAGEAWIGLWACEPALSRPLDALTQFVETIPSRGSSFCDHQARLLIIDTLLERSAWGEAARQIEAASHITSHWPRWRSEMLRLQGRLKQGTGQRSAGEQLWQHAFEVDTRGWNLPGALRCLDLLGGTCPSKDLMMQCASAFPEWLEADLTGEALAPLARQQNMHRLAMKGLVDPAIVRADSIL